MMLNYKTILFLVLSVSTISCIQNKNLYSGSDDDKKTSTDSTKQKVKVDWSLPYLYSFSDEVNNVTAEIIIKTNSNISATNVKAMMPFLKYNKTWLMMLTQDDCKHGAYSRTFAKINGRPVSSSEAYSVGNHDLYYDYFQYANGDLPPNVKSAQHSLGSTDGTGNEVRFSFTTTLASEEAFMHASIAVNKGFSDNYYRFYMKSGLVWSDVMDMLNYGTGIAFHDVKATDVKSESDVLAHLKIAQDSILNNLSGRGCMFLAEPNGNKTYVQAGLQYPIVQTLVAQSGGTILYPFKVTSDLKNVLLQRVFYDTIPSIKKDIQTQMTLPKENRKAIMIGVHSTDNPWMDFLQWVNDNYGESGDDSVWFTSQEEYYEYNYYRNHSKQTIEQVDSKTLKLTVTLPGGTYFYFPTLTVNLSGLKSSDIASISASDAVTGLSSANYDNGLMLNIGCRKHLLEFATHCVEKYEADKTNSINKADAIYFVKQLKPSDSKKGLLSRLGL